MEQHFSAPGRTELGGNHTDHQHGCVLAAAVDLTTEATAEANGTRLIRIRSEGYAPFEVDLTDLAPKDGEKGRTASLVRGVAAGIRSRGGVVGGFDAAVTSTVLPGSGLSSSAAFEVLMGRIFSGLFAENHFSAMEIAQIGQYAENQYFGKPCGLMDQMACSVGGAVFMDFARPDSPQVERLDVDLAKSGYALCIIDCGADHAELTAQYAEIPEEMRRVAALLDGEVLGDVAPAAFYRQLPMIRRRAGDRATLRAMHFFAETRRARQEAQALKKQDFRTFLALVNESGLSSWTMLQNVVPAGADERQPMAFALALCRQALGGKGACRVHGGGFAGTVQAFVPALMLPAFCAEVEAVLGDGCCHVLTIPRVTDSI